MLAEFSITPIGKGVSVSAYVARSMDIIDKSGLPYKAGPMGTCVEGEWDEVMALMKKCLDAIMADCERASVSIKIDYRQGKTDALTGKLKSVEEKLNREIKK
ncbi:MAG: MTH1187 family thiamine-binding protein [Deltaproteobacteria bacterium]|nr:MTH1187 family thiamine-binding protein [Deltaproteobacteria bacterium]